MPSSSSDFSHQIRQVFEHHVALYCERDLRFAACFSPDFSGLPPDGNTFLRERDTWLEALLQDYELVPGPLGMQVLDWNVQSLGAEICLITALCRVQRPQRDRHGALEAGPIMRWVQLLRLEAGVWKILHHSTSVSTPNHQSGPLGASAPRHGWLQWLDWLRPAPVCAKAKETPVVPLAVKGSSITHTSDGATPTEGEPMSWPARYAALEAAYIHSELQAQRTIAHLRSTDAWTGLGSRWLWDTALPTAWQRALHEGRLLGLVLLQLDQWWHFRARHGQLAADRCVQAVAVALQQASPDTSSSSQVDAGQAVYPVQPWLTQYAHAGAVPAVSLNDDTQKISPWCPIRLADDRFALLLWEADLEATTVQAQRWHKAVAELAVPHSERQGAVLTASVSAASIEPVRGGAPDDLLRAADIALQCAVSRGGDRVANIHDVA